jgi:outer membrane protein
MKNFTLGLNVVLVIAVAILFYLHFSSTTKKDNSNNNAVTAAGAVKVAYFEMDSVQSQFEYYKETRNSLVAKDQSLSRELAQMENSFAKKYQDLQKTAQGMSQAELASKQQELVEMDKNLKSKKQMMEQELSEESTRKLQDVKKKIEDYLKEYNKTKGFSYIISNSTDLIYYKDSTFNVTTDLIKGLNQLYKKKN